MIIRRLGIDDLYLLKRLYYQLTGSEPLLSIMQQVYRETLNDSVYTLWGGFVDNRLVASACLTKCLDLTDECRYYYSMENFIVDIEYRRKGIGRSFLDFLENYVKSQGGRYINFTSSINRPEAHTFYESCGYQSDIVRGFKKRFD